MNKLTPIQRIVAEYRHVQDDGHGLTYKAMADAIAENVNGFKLSRQTLWFWESGKEGPKLETLVRIRAAFPDDDWRHELAVDLMAALIPDVYQPVGEIGKRILSE